ncbi:MAG: serine/threonine-protein kinase [Gemmatimonadota bacterium]|nr:serine/threonine-protein kinase [Gemmatimonadota bacterium]
MIGQTISHFRILEKLGGGGMGVVYLAEDQHLDRRVALKFLPPHLSTDEEAKQRFIQEAKAASALNHQNICTIHDIDESEPAPGEPGGQLFIAMAHYEGETLKKKLEAGALSLEETAAIGRQVAEGLAKAHEKGIIHRDIKPANVMMTDDGRVVILDFGLAKLAGSLGLTKSGSTLGTAFYMSPEQIRGEEVDRRTDIWSLGVLLYEMLLGQKPFVGDYEQAISYAILNCEPSPVSGASENVYRVVERCLAKDPDERYQNCHELLNDLKAGDTAPSLDQKPTGATAPRRSLGIGVTIGVITLIVVIAAVAAVLLLRSTGGPEMVLGKSYPLLTTRALEDSPTWSPTGDRIAYHSRASGNSDIWVVTIGGGAPVNVTEDSEDEDTYPAWSPDGSRLAFLSSRSGGGLFVMPMPPAQPRRIAAPPMVQSRPAWSPDGSTLSYTVGDTLKMVDLISGRTEDVLLEGTNLRRWDLSFSPDGRFLAYVDAGQRESESDRLWVMTMSDGSTVPITMRHGAFRSPFWDPTGEALFFVSNLGGITDIWKQSLNKSGRPVGELTRVTNGIGIRDLSASATGAAIAFSKGHYIGAWNLWKVPILNDRLATWADAEKLTDDSALIEWSDLSADGNRLLFSSDRLGNQDLWLKDLETGELTQLTANPENDWGPRWSPDESEIVFYSDRAGNRDIFVLSVESGFVRQITDRPTEQVLHPDWSPDGSEIWFAVWTGSQIISSIPSVGGTATERFRGFLPRWSPAGVYMSYRDRRGVWLSSGQGPSKLLTSEYECGGWTANGRHPLCTKEDDIYELDLAGTARRLTDLSGAEGKLGLSYSISAAEDFMVFSWDEEVSDVWVMEIEYE